jgi:hypothetical protein
MRIWKAALRAGETAGIRYEPNRFSLTGRWRRVVSESAAKKFGGGEALFAFELEFEEFEPGIFGTADERRWSSMSKWPGDARTEPAGSDSALAGSAATAMRWTMSFLPSSVVNAPGQGWKPRQRL